MAITSDIVNLISRQGDIQAEGALREGQIRADVARRKQELWTEIIGQAANVALNLPFRIQAYKEGALKLRALRSSMQQDEAIGAILKKHQQLYNLELQTRPGAMLGVGPPQPMAPTPASGMSLADISKMASSFGAMPSAGGMP